jgi:hypothetical protein
MPAIATASAEIRAGRFMFLSFSFRSCLCFARLELEKSWQPAG